MLNPNIDLRPDSLELSIIGQFSMPLLKGLQPLLTQNFQIEDVIIKIIIIIEFNYY